MSTIRGLELFSQSLTVARLGGISFGRSEAEIWDDPREELTDELWALVAPFVAREPACTGRPRVDDHAALNGVLWVLRAGARWKDLPERFPSYQTCHRRF